MSLFACVLPDVEFECQSSRPGRSHSRGGGDQGKQGSEDASVSETVTYHRVQHVLQVVRRDS